MATSNGSRFIFFAFGTDRWNGVSKDRSSQRAPIKRKVTRNTAWTVDFGKKTDARLISQGIKKYRELARSQVLAAWPQILQGLIKKATGGGYQHAKLLLDLCELAKKEPDKSNQYAEEQLCDALLNKLKLRPPE